MVDFIPKLSPSNLLTRKIELGVTGLARAGKTVFITALLHDLLRAETTAAKSPLRGFGPFDEGRLVGAVLRHDANATVPEFPYGQTLRALTGETPSWPQPTEGISRIRVELRYRRGRGLRAVAAGRGLGSGESLLTLDIVDYPGEWLVDLPMLEQDFETWSQAMLDQARLGPRAELSRDWLSFVTQRAPDTAHDEEYAAEAARLYTEYLRACAERGLRFLQPGRFLTPGSLRGAAVLRFCPLPGAQAGAKPGRGSLHEAFRAKYRDYQDKVVRDFYRRHFTALDRQIVLIDALRALDAGPTVFEDMSQALAAILGNFRHGRSGPLSWLTGRRGIDKVLFAATKADHVIRGDRLHLENLTRRMLHVVDESNRIKTSAEIQVAAIAAIRCTEDMRRSDTGREILFGRRPGDTEEQAFDPGAVPLDFPPRWDAFRYRFWDFQPRNDPAWRHGGFPAIKLAEALDFLIGEDMT